MVCSDWIMKTSFQPNHPNPYYTFCIDEFLVQSLRNQFNKQNSIYPEEFAIVYSSNREAMEESAFSSCNLNVCNNAPH
jgi:hypothetical protein